MKKLIPKQRLFIDIYCLRNQANGFSHTIIVHVYRLMCDNHGCLVLIVNLGMRLCCMHMSWQSEVGQDLVVALEPSTLLESTTSGGETSTLCLHLPKHLIALNFLLVCSVWKQFCG